MRILGVGEHLCLGDMFRRLVAEGHEVIASASRPEAARVMHGIVPRCTDWRDRLDWVRRAGDDGVIVFETASQGEEQDQLRRDGFNVIGGCAWGDRLENDRAFGQQILSSLGLPTAQTFTFNNVERAITFVRERPARYVFKLCGSHAASTRNYVGQLEDGADVIALMRFEAQRGIERDGDADFVLMDHVRGVEIGVGAYFDGERFLRPACLDWEHKHFFPGDLGELTGEMGTVVTYRDSEVLFEQSLLKVEPALREAGYCGYINLNTIVNEDGIWPLEFTCRFGYPGYSICASLHDESWERIFRRMLRQRTGDIATRSGYSLGIVVSTPPFPYMAPVSADIPLFFRGDLSEADRENLHYGDIALDGEQLVVCGPYGEAMVVTGVHDDLQQAREQVYARVRKLVIPNMRYRADIGEKLLREDLARLQDLGLLRRG